MREYYGELHSDTRYMEDENHKFIPWKQHPFSFELKNATQYTLEVRQTWNIVIVKPSEDTLIRCDSWWKGTMEVCVKENSSIKCNFIVERGCLIERNLVKDIQKGKHYIAPVFKDGNITIVTCNDCGPNLGLKPKYIVNPLKNPANTIRISNYTIYNIIVWSEGQIIKMIRGRKKEYEPTSEYVGIPLNGILYIDTEVEEVAWTDKYHIYEEAIYRVNGCCFEIKNGNYYGRYCTVVGPELAEPYIRHLYVSKDQLGNVEIWCNTIDYRLD